MMHETQRLSHCALKCFKLTKRGLYVKEANAKSTLGEKHSDFQASFSNPAFEVPYSPSGQSLPLRKSICPQIPHPSTFPLAPEPEHTIVGGHGCMDGLCSRGSIHVSVSPPTLRPKLSHHHNLVYPAGAQKIKQLNYFKLLTKRIACTFSLFL